MRTLKDAPSVAVLRVSASLLCVWLKWVELWERGCGTHQCEQSLGTGEGRRNEWQLQIDRSRQSEAVAALSGVCVCFTLSAHSSVCKYSLLKKDTVKPTQSCTLNKQRLPDEDTRAGLGILPKRVLNTLLSFSLVSVPTDPSTDQPTGHTPNETWTQLSFIKLHCAFKILLLSSFLFLLLLLLLFKLILLKCTLGLVYFILLL